jgi:hypothetical protein
VSDVIASITFIKTLVSLPSFSLSSPDTSR